MKNEMTLDKTGLTIPGSVLAECGMAGVDLSAQMTHSANSLPGMVRPVLSSVISFFMIDPPQVLKGRSGICTSRHIFPSLL